MISKKAARNIAYKEIKLSLEYGDSPFDSWLNGDVGEPVLVRNLHRDPSYWIVPFIDRDHVVGFVRVLIDGRIFAKGSFCIDKSQINKCPKIITGISADEARSFANNLIQSSIEQSITDPIFIHDGPLGREVWLVETKVGSRPHRWLFITKGGIYDRPAGTTLGETTEE